MLLYRIMLGAGILQLFWANVILTKYDDWGMRLIGIGLALFGVWDVIDALVSMEVLP